MNFKRQKLKLGFFNGLPSFSKPLVQRMTKGIPELADFTPVELCNLEYLPERGSSIDPHLDDSWLWGERLVTLNLLSHTFLTFSITHPHPTTNTHPHTITSPAPHPLNHITEIHIPLLRRSLVIVGGTARHHWLHSVKRRHIVSRRVGITLRELSQEFLPGGREEEVGHRLTEIAGRFDGQPTNFRTESTLSA